MKPVHFYHVWAGDHYHRSAWHAPALEHFDALRHARFDGEVLVGMTGEPTHCGYVYKFLREAWPAARVIAREDEGFEQVTINYMHRWVKEAKPDTPVYYAHTKGALNNSPANTRWRRAMESVLTDNWYARVTDLADYDAVGMHWLTHEKFPDHINPRRPMFAGNFWWANAGYLAKLEPATSGNRWQAEGWMGTGFPKVLDLMPGWPDYARDIPVALGLTQA